MLEIPLLFPFFSFSATFTSLVPFVLFFLCIIPFLLDNIAPNNISSCLVPLLAGLLLEHLRPLSVLMLELLLDVLKLLQLLLPHPGEHGPGGWWNQYITTEPPAGGSIEARPTLLPASVSGWPREGADQPLPHRHLSHPSLSHS